MKWLIGGVMGLFLVAVVLYQVAVQTTAGQDFLMSRAIQSMARAEESKDSLRAFVCGSASPLPTVGRAQACIAVLTPAHFFVVDAGSGSANNLSVGQLPVDRMNGVLLTHFHSDHIADVPGVNLVGWAGGRQGPLRVYGPPGVERITAGLNDAYAMDRGYRTSHHGATFMPEPSGLLEPVELRPGTPLNFGDLTITPFVVDHHPVSPAVGYRFDYKGRSIVVTGDTVVTDELRGRVAGIDLLLSDALSMPLVNLLQEAARAGGAERGIKILEDIKDYHADVVDVAALTETSDIGMTGLYHLVPGPRNELMEKVFARDLGERMVLTSDRMWFELPVGSTDINIK